MSRPAADGREESLMKLPPRQVSVEPTTSSWSPLTRNAGVSCDGPTGGNATERTTERCDLFTCTKTRPLYRAAPACLADKN